MENQVTMSIDITNSLAAMAFVVADQQRVIKELQCEINQSRVNYDEFDKECKNLQNKYDDDVAGFCRTIDQCRKDINELSEDIRQKSKEISRLEEDNAAMKLNLQTMPDWHLCSVENKENGNHYLAGFDHDGPVVLSFYIKEGGGGFWDCFNCQRHTGEIAYMGVIVEHGIVENPLYAVDFDKEVKYIALSDFVDYQITSDDESQS